MTDILTLIESLAPLILLIAIPIVAIRMLDTEDLRDLGPAPGAEITPDACPSPSRDIRPPVPEAGPRHAERPMRPMAAIPDLGWPASQVDA